MKTTIHQIWIDLGSRPIGTGIGAVAIAVEVAMVLSFVGISSGILHDFGTRVQGVGADVILQPPNASLLFSLDIIIGLAALISFLVVLMTMYTSVLERVSEIGVRRVVGARRGE